MRAALANEHKSSIIHHVLFVDLTTYCTWTRGARHEPNVGMETFSSNLKGRAEQLGISNAEVARRVGLIERRYGNYISGTRQPDRSLVKISSVLKTSLDELLSNEVNKPAKSTKRNLQERIASAVEVLNEDDLARIAIMLDALAAARS